MSTKTIIAILLAGFVAIALGVIVMRPGGAAPANDVRPIASPIPSVVQTTAAVTTGVPSTVPTEPVEPARAEKQPTIGTPARGATSGVPSIASTLPAIRDPESVRRVVATYFHGNVRCTTCRKVEAYAREAVEEGFRPQIAAGTVEFRAVNVEEAQNTHFVQDYQLVNKSVVVTEELDGKVARWAKLDEVWSLVGNRDAYHHYVQDAVRGYLETE